MQTLDKIGLGYISIDRPTATLSGGEAQRLRIATQLVADLCGLTYILDEPTIGLHPYDTQHLMDAIQKLKDYGNTVIIVEHDPDIIKQAEHIIDLGPGAGTYGGQIVAQGNLDTILKNSDSPTGKYLRKSRSQIPSETRQLSAGIEIRSASANNLQQFDLDIPSGGIVAITGLSGSGKTSLAFDVIANSYLAGHAVNCQQISFNNIDNLLVIDQQKIGTSPLSTAATYTGMFDLIREMFSTIPDAKSKGFRKSHFSFNSKDGRCESCKGMGHQKVSMDFLSDVWVICDTCHGQRYKKEILDIQFKGLSISDVLQLEISEAILVFQENDKINKILKVLEEIGLGYITLGQATSTLSGGETQRLKLAAHLIKERNGQSLFIFDEPSTGLHMQDVERLIHVFRKLIGNGNSIIVVEHNQDIIRTADWIIDLGPQGGDKGGALLYSGIVSGIGNCMDSFTGKSLF